MSLQHLFVHFSMFVRRDDENLFRCRMQLLPVITSATPDLITDTPSPGEGQHVIIITSKYTVGINLNAGPANTNKQTKKQTDCGRL